MSVYTHREKSLFLRGALRQSVVAVAFLLLLIPGQGLHNNLLWPFAVLTFLQRGSGEVSEAACVQLVHVKLNA